MKLKENLTAKPDMSLTERLKTLKLNDAPSSPSDLS